MFWLLFLFNFYGDTQVKWAWLCGFWGSLVMFLSFSFLLYKYGTILQNTHGLETEANSCHQERFPVVRASNKITYVSRLYGHPVVATSMRWKEDLLK